jgi:AbrB family looped-hinge helix DNA binding protein
MITRVLKERAHRFTLLFPRCNRAMSNVDAGVDNSTQLCEAYKIRKNQELRISETDEPMSEYLQVRNNGQITLPAATRRKAKLQEGDLLEAVVEEDGSIRLVPKTPVDRKLAEQYQLKDINWALKQKRGSKK